MNFCVIITGSKFFAGPSFSGAVFIPQKWSLALQQENLLVPEGYSDYFSRYFVDKNLSHLHKHFSQEKNVGLFLRWQAALYEINRFYSFDETIHNQIINEWISQATQLIKKRDCVEFLVTDNDIYDKHLILGQKNTILPFTVRKKSHTFFRKSNIKR